MLVGERPNGYTNNMGVIWTTVIVLLGQWCACGTQGRSRQCKVMLELPGTHHIVGVTVGGAPLLT